MRASISAYAFAILVIIATSTSSLPADEPSIVAVVIGAGGTPEYEQNFHQWADRWREAAALAKADHIEIGRDKQDKTDRAQLEALLADKTEGATPFWLVLIGHGTFDRELAKFNLRGPDISAAELSKQLDAMSRPLIIVNCSSSSGPFINRLSGNDRVIVTATNSGLEQNYSRFGNYLSIAIADPAADLDHDEQVSLLEAYLSASAGVARFYEQAARLATEHPLLDDNGDKLGTPPTFFRGFRAVQSARGGAEPDGRAAHRYILVPGKNQPVLSASQLQRRDQLEAAIEELRAQKSTVAEARYYEHLETLMVQLARLYEEADEAPSASDSL